VCDDGPDAPVYLLPCLNSSPCDFDHDKSMYTRTFLENVSTLWVGGRNWQLIG